MKKRIYLNMALLTITALLLVSVCLCFVFYNQFSSAVRAEIRERAELFRGMDAAAATDALRRSAPDDMRMTVIGADGSVLYDSSVSADNLENHANREEIVEALNGGYGESKRYSDTLGEETCYYAVRLTDGDVLRAAKTTHSIFAIFEQALPVTIVLVLFVIIISYVAAGNLTRRIVNPINSVNLNEELGTPPYDELAPFVRAITEQRAQIKSQILEIGKRSDTINAIMENMNEGAVLLNRAGEILSANRSALRIFGADTPMADRNIRELFRDKLLLERTFAALSGERSELSIGRGGRAYQIFFSPVTEYQGEVIGRLAADTETESARLLAQPETGGAILLFLDVTERTEAEKLRREFSANVSHELKTPLTSISGYAEMLAGGMVKETDQAEFIRRIRDESGRLIALVEDIMLISRLDEGISSESFESVDVAELSERVVEQLAPKAADAGVSTRLTGTATLSHANRTMIEELLFNLIDNAIKYNKPDGRVDVTLSETGGQVLLRVSDTGVGIPLDAQSRVFERFYRVDGSRFKKTGGTGLGLAIVKHIARIHGAKITLKSREGEGTAIELCFQEQNM